MQAPGLGSRTHIENDDSEMGKFVCPGRQKPWRFAANINKLFRADGGDRFAGMATGQGATGGYEVGSHSLERHP